MAKRKGESRINQDSPSSFSKSSRIEDGIENITHKGEKQSVESMIFAIILGVSYKAVVLGRGNGG